MKKDFNSVREKDSYAFDRIQSLMESGVGKSTAIKKVRSEICDISEATTWLRYQREERRRKEVETDGQ